MNTFLVLNAKIKLQKMATLLASALLIVSCTEQKSNKPNIEGTWKLISALNITGTDSTFTDYTVGMEGIKIIGKTHFSFFQHDLNHGKDSTAMYASGAGSYSFDGVHYKENLEYCTSRAWENNSFEFNVEVRNDSLFQIGLEKIEALGVDRKIIETYILVK